MRLVQTKLVDELEELSRHVETAEAVFLGQHGTEVETYRYAIQEGVKEVLAGLRAGVREVAGDSRVCAQLMEQTAEYVDWLQWTLWDLPYFAVAVRPPIERFRQAVAACALAYLSLRVFDDITDRHFWYKGRHPTLLRVASEKYPGAQGAEGLTVLAGLLICLEGLNRLSQSGDPHLERLVRPVLSSLRRTVIGAVMERGGPDDLNRDSYDRIVQLKNVDYWRTLYVALDPDLSAPMYPFLERYYTLAQHLNDVHDVADDESRGQPNLMSVAEGGRESVERMLADSFLELGRIADGLPEVDGQVARLKLSESLREARRLGLFADFVERDDAAPSVPTIGVQWHTELRQLLERAGPDAVERASCGACGEPRRSYLFQKQGFTYHRCLGCSHVYVSPRLASSPGTRVTVDSEGLPDPFLAVQRATAGSVCQRLQAHAPGPRLLDIGFGRGYVMRTARAYGFEVYGIDGSESEIESLREEFGKHLHGVVREDQAIPGGPFDAVVMSHVLDQAADPDTALIRVRLAMSPGAVLYIAVPDIDSIQFQILGKRWEVVSPLVHCQYFNEKSLRRLLERTGFVDPHRLAPAVVGDTSSRWVHMVRSLGGSDTGELAMVARVQP